MFFRPPSPDLIFFAFSGVKIFCFFAFGSKKQKKQNILPPRELPRAKKQKKQNILVPRGRPEGKKSKKAKYVDPAPGPKKQKKQKSKIFCSVGNP